VDAEILVGLVLSLISTALTNLAYLREHDAAAALPALAMRRPLQSARLLLDNRSWLRGFAMESGGFLLYAAALGLASLALVQSIQAGGIGILAVLSSRLARRRLSGRELAGVLASVLGLVALAVSLTGGSSSSSSGSNGAIALWLGVCAAVALGVLALGRRVGSVAVSHGVAGGLFFSIGDVSTKIVTQGGVRIGFLVTIVLGYAVGTGLIQVGYQSGGPLTVAGLATLLTNAVPIAAGTIVLHEQVPSGVLGALRVLAFAAVTAGAVLLARPQTPSSPQRAPAALGASNT
jgi:drug/metabolite transporter (DMT)-like permease